DADGGERAPSGRSLSTARSATLSAQVDRTAHHAVRAGADPGRRAALARLVGASAVHRGVGTAHHRFRVATHVARESGPNHYVHGWITGADRGLQSITYQLLVAVGAGLVAGGR